ncbi:UNVERIFIED_CONTAM: hypothetical protein B566_EDAN019539, partial [Ephemera danica]
FEIWKEDEEKVNCSSYTRRHNSNKATGEHQTLFICHRDGCYVSKSTGERRLKSQGSCKMEGNCPASIVLTFDSNQSKEYKVRYIRTHVGHEMELGHMRLPQSGKLLVTEKLKCKIPPKVILDDVKTYESPGSRLRCLTSKDIHNIKQSSGIQEEFKLDQNDHASVNMWAERLKERNQILYYKPQGSLDPDHPELEESEFALILQTEEQAELAKKFCNEDDDKQTGSKIVCIDSTHGLGYDMQLTTLMSLDETGAGFPLAEMISSKVNANTLNLFFSCLKARTGTLKCSFFMSDDFPGFFNSWTHVMGTFSTKKLLCSWHVDKSWKSHFNMKDEHQQQLYKDMKTLQMEPDPKIFEAAMEGLLQKIKESPEIKHLEKYVERYSKRSQEWAYCYRLDSHMSTNMFLEAYHKKLKYVYFDGKVMRRIDKSLYLLLKLIRDASIEREVRLMKNTTTFRVQKINRAHDSAQKISSTDIDKLQQETNAWTVKSQSCDGYYVVKQEHAECSLYGDTCKIRCNTCYVCVHMMTCNCVEAMVGAGLCKHIHAVVMKFFVHMNLLSKPKLLSHQEMMQQDHVEDINAALVIPTQIELRGKKIKEQLQCLQALAHAKLPYCDNKAMDSIESQLKVVQSILISSNTPQPCPNVSVYVHPNKNVEPQQRMISTKKKKSKMLSLRKPNLVERGQRVEKLLKRRRVPDLPNVYDMMSSDDSE